jgi:shikimate dehydrogenase
MKTRYGLIGYPLGHTFSPGYFKDKFDKEGIQDISYHSYPLKDITMLKSLLTSGVNGLNITIPYKEQSIPYVDRLSEEAAFIGAINTIKVTPAETIGYNTDVYGFRKSLEESFNLPKGTKALVLGTGGASKAVCYVLDQLNISYLMVSRSLPHLRYQDLTEEIMATHSLIINTTPLGMYPQIDDAPEIPYNYLTSEHMAFDLVYNPVKTLFLRNIELAGGKIKNGYDMLVYQAEKSWYIWNELH